MNLEQLKKEGVIKFNNAEDLDSEAYEIELEYGQISTWDGPFKLFVNGELEASYKTFGGLKKRAEVFINVHDLKAVQ